MIDLAAIRAARDNIAGDVLNTPFVHSRTLSEIVGAQLWLKFENLQFTRRSRSAVRSIDSRR